jgi:hypothetical protein
MGTRSLTHIYNNDGALLLTMYRQFDGYPEGMGLDLAKFISQFTIVNGIGSDQEGKIANGMGCLAAQLIAELKDCVGNVYIYPPNSKDCWEEFTYHIFKDKMVCRDYKNK